MEFIQKFKSFLLLQKPVPSPATVKNYVVDVKHFISWYESFLSRPFNPDEVTVATIDQFKKQKASSYSIRSIERNISSLRKFFYGLKLQGIISSSPFDEVIPSADALAKADPWHLKEFKDFLYVYNASRLTIKNYIIDVRQFLHWVEEVSRSRDAARVSEKNVFTYISNPLLEEYKVRLGQEGSFSASSINRKLSSLRKYLNWTTQQGLLQTQIAIPDNLNNNQIISSTQENTVLEKDINTYLNTSGALPVSENKPQSYSKFPPLRLIQKIGKGIDLSTEALLILPITKAVIVAHKQIWKMQGKKLFVEPGEVKGRLPMLAFIPKVSNIKKAIYAPHAISIKYFPWYRKAIYHARYTRPVWYRRYHELALAHYFNWAILIVFCTAIGFGMYNSFVAKPKQNPSLAASAPPRILSFQGRLTDSTDNPISASTNLRFAIYSDLSATGSALLWQEVNGVIPDKNGVFSVLLGKGTTIPQSLFANNQNLYLGITVGQTPELTPRQQLATVAYATNSETLQGMPPITQSGAGTNNVILALDSSGNLSIGASTTFQSTTGQFTVAGNTVAFNTNAGSNGNITFAPDGSGLIDLQKPLVNTSLNNNIGTNLGAVEVDDLFAVLATSAASATIINQDGTGALISASSAGAAKFTVGNVGDITSANYTVDGGILYTNGTGLFLQTSAGSLGQCLTSNGGGAPAWAGCGSGSNFWTLDGANGTLSPINSTLDVFFGGTSSSSANFAFINNAPGSGTPTASISGNLTLNSNGAIQTTNNQALTIGGNSTGNIIISPLNGLGNVTIAGLTAGIVHSNNVGVITSSALNLAGGATEVTGLLPLANGGTNNNLTPSNGGVVYSDATKLQILAASATVGQCLLSGGSGAPSWGNCTVGGGNNWWNMNLGTLFPVNTTLDLVLGGTATGSAKFGVLNLANGTPTASISSGLNGSGLFLAANGVIQTTNNQGLTLGGNSTGNIILSPLNGAGTVTINGKINSNLVPAITDTYDVGSSSLEWNNVYVKNLIASGNISGFFQRNLGVIAPANITDDFAVGGTSTTSAKFQVFGNTGNATTSGTLTFDGSGNLIQTTKNQGLTIGGNTTGNISLSPLNGNGTVTINGEIASSLIPSQNNTFDLGSPALEWRNIFASGNFAGFWQRFLGVVSPTNTTDDLAIGGTSTTSAKFQISGTTGNATTAGNLTFNGNGNIQTTNNSALTLGGSSTGNIILSPLNGSGNVTVTGLGTGVVQSTAGVLSTGAVNLTTEVTGILPIANGGTNTNALGAAGAVAYSNGSAYAFTVVGSAGQCLVSNGSSAPFWDSCSTAAGANNFWTLDNGLGTLYPINSTLDVFFGGTSTSSANFAFINNAAGTPTASIAGNLTLNSNGAIQTTKNQPLTIGGNSTGNITLSPNNGTGILSLNTPTILTNQSTISLFNTTATTINFGGAADINLSNAGKTTTINGGLTTAGTTNLNGNVNLGDTTGDQINVAGRFVSSLIPNTTNLYDLGSPSLEWNNLYVNNIISGGNISGFWQRFSGVISPVNITDDLAIGGTSTSAAKFQVFANTGNATTAGNLTFNGNGNIQTTNNSALTLGGNTTGNIILSPLNGSGNVTINGNQLITTASSFDLLNTTATTINLGGAATTANLVTNATTLHLGDAAGSNTISVGGATGTTTVNNALTATGVFTANNTANLNGNVNLGDTTGDIITATGRFGSSLIPTTTDTYDLGSSTLEWNNLFVKNIISGGNISGFWQRFLGVVSPTNIADDLAIGGTSTSAAKFQIFGNTGNATTAGNLTFNGNGNIQTTNNSPLTLGGNTTGNIILSPNNGTGSLTVNGTINSNLTPTTTNTYDLGSPSLAWNNLYVKNIISTGNISGFWQRFLGVVSPTNITDDLAIGGTSTSSALFQIFGDTGNATTAGNLTFNGNGNIQTTNNSALTLGGDTTGNIILSPLNGSGNITINGNQLNTTASSFDLLNTTATTINFGGAATTANLVTNATAIHLGDAGITNTLSLGGTGGTTTVNNALTATGVFTANNTANLNGNINLGDTNTDQINPIGVFIGSLIPNTTAVNLGSASNYFGSAYITNLFPSATSNFEGFLQRFNGVLSPTNIADDLAIGGTSTTAAKFQIFGNTGNATTAGNLTFNGNGQIQTTNNSPLTLGGNTTGNIILSPNNGAGAITVNGKFNSSLLPFTTNTYDLGSPSLSWNNLYVSNIISTGNISGFWQRNLGVLSPANITDDFALGGTATHSALFQVFGNTGNATTAGNLTFNGNGQIQTTNNQAFTLGGNTTGNIILSPLNGSGTVTITGLGTGVVHSTTGVLSSSAVSLTTDVSGILPLANGGTSNNLTADNGGIVYSDATKLQILAHSSTVGQCLLSGGSGTPSWGNCTLGGGVNWWNMNQGSLFPVNTTLDLLLGGSATTSAKFAVLNMTGSGTPTASVSSGLNGNGLSIAADGSIQTTNNQGLTLGGNTTGNITLSPLNGGVGGTVTFNNSTIATTQTTLSLFNTTATTINLGGAADINLSNAGKTTTVNGALTVAGITNLNGNINLGDTTGDTITATGRFGSSLVPTTTDTYDLGSSSLEWNNLYIRNIISGGNISGFWQRFLGVLSPTNITDDLTVGGTATNSALFQIFGNTGNATTAGNLTFNGNGTIQTTNNQPLTLGGNSTGNIILSPNNGTGAVTINGNKLLTTASSFDLLNTTATTINLGGAADINLSNAGKTTTVNGALTVAGITNLNGNINLGDASSDTITATGQFGSSLIPKTTDTYDLGSSSLEWNNLYVKNIISGGNVAGFWQRFLGVISPANISDDLAIGGTATSTAKFQIFGNTGNATTAGNLTFNGNGNIQTTNNSALTLGGSSTGNIILSPLNGSGTVTIDGSKLLTTASSFDLFNTTATTINFGGAADINLSNAGKTTTVNGALTVAGTTNLNGNINLGDANSDTINPIGVFSGSLIPQSTSVNVGSSTNFFGSAFLTNVFTSASSNFQGFFQRFSGVLSPTNIADDLAIGGTATNTAKFQIFGNTGNATTAGNLTFNGNGLIQTTNNSPLTLGGNSTGNIVLSPNNGAGSVTINGTFNTDLVPTLTDTYNIGSPSLEWNNFYVRNLISGGNISGFWQRFLGVVAPVNITDDLAIGGSATSSALFQVFGTTGNATTAGNLTFNGNGVIQSTNNKPLTLGGNTTGAVNISASNGSGTINLDGSLVNITATNPTISTLSNNSLSLLAGTGTITLGTNTTGGDIQFFNSSSKITNAGALTTAGTITVNGIGSSFIAGTLGIGTSPLTAVGLDVEKNSLGNTLSVFKQLSSASSADIISASNSAGLTQFTLTNTGIIKAHSFQDLDNTSYLLDPAATGNSLLVAGTIGVGTLTPLSLSGIDVEKDAQGNAALVVANLNTAGDLITASNSAGTKFTIQNDGTIKDAKYTTDKGILYADGTGTFGQTAQGAAHTFLRGNGTGVPTFVAIDLTADVGASILPLANGGTNNNLTADNGGIVYSDATKLQILAHSATIGQCLLSGGSGSPTWGNCTTGGGTNWWNVNLGTLYPINTTLDLLLGGSSTDSAKFAVTNMTGSGTPTASVSSGLNGNGLSIGADGTIQTTRNQALTLGGNTTGNIILSPLNGSGNVTINGNKLITAASSFDLLNTNATTINFGGAATTANLTIAATSLHLADSAISNTLSIGGTGGGTTTVNNALTATGIFTANNTANLNGNVNLGDANSDLINPIGVFSGSLIPNATSVNLGSASNYYGSAFVTNLFPASGSNFEGFLQRFNGVLSPTNIADDLAIGGTATSTAKFQIFGNTGNATTAGNLTFNGNGLIQTTNNSPLTLGGNSTGNIILSPNNGSGAVTVNGTVNSNLIPTATNTYDLGSLALQWNNVYANNVFVNGQPLSQVWQRNLGVLAPQNITDDVAVGGTSTSSAKFQIFGLTGNATTAGTLTFTSGASQIQTTSNQTLTLGGNTTGGITLSPSNGSGIVTLNSPTLATTQTSLNVFNTTATTINFGGAGDVNISNASKTTTINGALTVAGTANLNGNINLGDATGDQINVTGRFVSSLLPNATNTYDLGSSSLEWNNIYGNNIFVGGNFDGFLQRFNGVLSPTNIADDLAIGGTATSTAKFQIFGNTGNATTGGTLTFNTSGNIQTTNNQSLTLGGNSTGNIILSPNNGSGAITINGKFNSSLLPFATNTYDLGSPSLQWNNVYANNVIVNGQPLSQVWQRNLGVLAPLNITDDLAIGGTATSTAKFQVFGLTGNATTAGTLTFSTGGSQIQTTSNQILTLGGNTTGGITLSPNNGGGIVTFNNPTLATTQTSINLFNTTATTINLGGAADINLSTSGKTTTVNGTLAVTGTSNLNGNVNLGDANSDLINPIGVFSGSLIPNATSVNLGSAANNFGSVFAQNLFLSGNYDGFWQRFNGAVSPANITDDLLIGGTSTSSAKFAFINNTGGGSPTATISGNLSLVVPTGATPAETLNLLNGGSLNIQHSAGGDAGLASSLFIDKAGHVGINDTNPTTSLVVGGSTGEVARFASGGGISDQNYIGIGGDRAFFGYNGSTSNTTIQGISAKGIDFNVNNNTFGSGTVAKITPNGFFGIGFASTTGIGNGQLVVNQPNTFGNGDIFAASSSGVAKFIITSDGGVGIANAVNDGSILSKTALDIRKDSFGNAALLVQNLNTVGDLITASNSAATQFTVTNAGIIKAHSFQDLDNTSYLLDPAASGNSLLVAGTIGVGTTSPLNLSGIDIEKDAQGNAALVVANLNTAGDLITASNSAGTKFTIQNDGTIKDAKYTTAGGVLFGTSTGVFTQTAAGTLGQCLTSTAGGTPVWQDCATGAGAGSWWTMTNGALYPINTTLDLFVGGAATTSAKFAVLNMTGSGTPVASVSSGLNGTSIYLSADGSLQTTRFSNLTVGGSTTGDIALTPHNGTGGVTINGTKLDGVSGTNSFDLLNTGLTTVNFAGGASTALNIGATSGTTTIKNSLAVQGNTLSTNQTTFNLINGTATTINFGAGATLGLNIGASNTPTNLEGNITLGTDASNTITSNGLYNADIIPSGNGSINLGSSSHYYNTVYANNFIAPVGNGTSGFWSLTNNVIFPVNTFYDLAIGGTATGSATPWQVFSSSLGVNTAGTATSSGGLSFRGTTTNFNLLNGSVLNINTSVGGDNSNTELSLANNGDLTLGGAHIITTQSQVDLFNTTATTLNIGGGATAAINFGNANGLNTLRGNLILGSGGTNTIFPQGKFSASIIPTSTGIDLGSLANNFGSVYATNLFLPTTNAYGGLWQLISNVVSPFTIANDLAIGGVSTASAKFQVFGTTGNATTTGTLTFNATGNLIQTTNFQPLAIGGNTTGTIQLSPKGVTGLYIDGSGNVGIGTTNPTAVLDVVGAASVSSTLTFRGGPGTIQATSNNILTLGGNTTGGISFGSNVASSIIPAKTDTYNLGSDPTTGGNEWDTLYVRQIISPVGGGIAGFWQLSNTGVLAPSNIANDVTVGGNSTASARFQVFATGSTAGTVKIAPSDPKINNNTGIVTAATNIINVASTDHTYMTLNNQDLTIGGHKNMQSISNIQKVFYYDTTKDSDGGRWTNDERAQAASWYSESRTAADACVLGTNTRCGQQAFPRKAILVLTTNANGSGGALYIFDAKDNSLWMEFDRGASGTNFLIGSTSNTTPQSVFAINGRIYVANTGGSGGIYILDLKQDTGFRYRTTTGGGMMQANKNIQNRNTSVTFTTIPGSNITLASANTNDVSGSIINGQTYIAVATAGSANGDVTLLNDSTLSVVANFGPNANAQHVWLTSRGTLYATVGNASTPADYALKIKYNAQNASGNSQLFDEVYANQGGTTNYGASTTDNNTFASLSLTAGPASTSATFIPSTMAVTEGTSPIDGVSDTVYLGAQGNNGSLMAFNLKKGDPSNGSIKYYTSSYVTEDMIGDIRAMYPLDSNVGSGLTDVSIKGNTLTNGSTAPTYNNSGVRNQAANLSTTAAEAHSTAANLLLTFKNSGGLSASAWVQPTSLTTGSGTRAVWVSSDQNGSANALAWGIGTKGDGTSAHIMCFVGTGTNTITDVDTTTTATANTWYHVALTSDASGNVKCYVNGQLTGRSDATAGTAITPTQFEIGSTRATTAIVGIVGNVDEVAVAASTWTSAEISHMYQIGYRALQNHSSQTIRGVTVAANASQKLINSNSNVSAVATNMQNGQIYIGTGGGGISVIGMDTDTIKDIYSSGISTTDDTGTLWSATASNNFVQSIAAGQSYGNGTALVIGTSPSSGNVWMETQDTTLKDFFATSYNPFGSSLTQSNLNIDSLLRVTNQSSTRLDNLAFGATSSAQLVDAFRVDSNGNLLSRSLVNSSTAMLFEDASSNNYLRLNTIGGLNDTAVNILQPGTGDIIIASSSAQTRLQLTNSGILRANSFQDLDDNRYFIDPAASTIAGAFNGSVGIGTTSPGQGSAGGGAALVLQINNSTNVVQRWTSGTVDMFAQAVAGDKAYFGTLSSHNVEFDTAGAARMTILSGGNVGIGTTGPNSRLDVLGGSLTTGTNNTYAFAVGNSSGSQGDFTIGSNGSYAFLQSWNSKPLQINGQGNNVYIPSSSLGIGNTNAQRTLDVTGSWGGNVINDSFDGCPAGATRNQGAALMYDFSFTYHGCASNHTINFNITGVPTVDGSFFFVSLRIDKTNSSGTGTLNLQVNSTSVDNITMTSQNGQDKMRGIAVYDSGSFLGGWIVVAEAAHVGNGGFDLAEYMPHGQENPPPGSIITNSTANKKLQIEESKTEYDQKAMGIVTTNPNLLFGGVDQETGQQTPPVNQSGIALSGRVPTIVTSLDGPIDKGDGIATSPILGTGMKPMRPTQTVGKAVEPFNPQDGTTICTDLTSFNAIEWPPDDGSNDPPPCFAIPVSGFDPPTQSILTTKYGLQLSDKVYIGKILVLVGNGFTDPDTYLTTTGDMHLTDASPSAELSVPHYFTLADIAGHPLTKMGGFLELVAANLRAGSISTEQLFTNSLAIATSNITIAGQSLHDYVAGIVSEVLNGQSAFINGQSITSPLAQIDSLHTNLISPLASGSAVALSLDNSGISVKNTISQQTVVRIDNSGNATFSGQLASQNLAVNGDATISGTLHADRIEANSIAGLQAVVGTLSAQNITNVTNIYFATPSANTIGSNNNMGSGYPGSSNSGALTPYLGYANIASYSGFLAYVPNLNTDTAMFSQGLMSLGATSLSDTTINGQLAIGTQLILADNAINVLGGTFQIQSLRQGNVSFEGGLIAIDTDGNLTVNGNAVFAKNLAANFITPLANDRDITLKLGENPTATGSALATANLSVQNASGSGIFNVDQLGNLIASGAASIAKLNFTAVQPVLAVSDTEVVATGSAGTAAIKAHQVEITIDNKLVTPKSLIYITPVGQTTYSPYLLRQVGGTSFTVGIPVDQYTDTTFNWLIVN